MAGRRRTRLDLPRRVYQRGPSLYFVDSAGRWHRLGRAKDYHACMAVYARLLGDDRPATTLSHVMDRYVRDVLPSRAPRTQRDAETELRNLRYAFGHMKPGQVEPRHVYAYMDARGAPVRANREVALLSQICQLAIRLGLLERNPCREVRRNPERPRRVYVGDAEFWRVYDDAETPPVIRAAMRLALVTGLRQGDLLALTRRAVTAEGLEVKAGKTGTALLFEWSPDLRAAVEECLALERPVSSVWLLCTRRGQRYTRTGFGAIWQRVRKRLGVEWTFHDLRAKSASDHATGEHLGHQDDRTLRRVYRRAPRRVTGLEVKR